MTNPKYKPVAQDPKNLIQLAREEIGAVSQEVVEQVAAREENKSVTRLPPFPGDQGQRGPVLSDQEQVAKNEGEQLKKVRARLAALEEESALVGKKLSQEREEKAQKRNPVVEGIGVGGEEEDSSGNGREDNDLSPPQTTSRPKKGLPLLGIGQPEKRKRR